MIMYDSTKVKRNDVVGIKLNFLGEKFQFQRNQSK